MRNIKIIIGGVLITLLIISISGCLSSVNQNEHQKPEDNYTEKTEKIVPNTIEIEKVDDIKLNSKPSFSVGHKYFYKTKTSGIQGGEGYYFEEHVYTIKGIKRINKTDYYVITCNNKGYLSPNPTLTRAKHFGNDINITWYCNKENGKCIGKNKNPERYSDENMFATDSSLFAYWMLGLKENLKWNMYLNSTYREGNKKYGFKVKYGFEVIGREKVNNIECFKVKMKYIDMNTKRVRYVRYYWVDVKRRILVKKEQFENGVKMYEENLIKEV